MMGPDIHESLYRRGWMHQEMHLPMTFILVDTEQYENATSLPLYAGYSLLLQLRQHQHARPITQADQGSVPTRLETAESGYYILK